MEVLHSICNEIECEFPDMKLEISRADETYTISFRIAAHALLGRHEAPLHEKVLRRLVRRRLATAHREVQTLARMVAVELEDSK